VQCWLLPVAILVLGPACGAGAPERDSGASTSGEPPETTLPTLVGTATQGDASDGTVSTTAASVTGDPGTSASTSGTSGGDPLPEPWDGPRTAFVHLFEWPWASIAHECEHVLGPGGFAAVQVSPPQEYPADVAGLPWWDRYQPVSYAIAGRSGDEAAFADMVARCSAVGVEVWVDAVVNHMAWQHQGVGIAGTQYDEYAYADLYQDAHFHGCRMSVADWSDRTEVQTCELFGLPDLDTAQPYVQEAIAGWLTGLVDLGVGGFRVDAAKHVASAELEAIFDLVVGEPYVFGEVIADQTIAADEYFGVGDVTEFAYGHTLADVFRTGDLAWLADLGEPWGFIASERAVVFLDNHDTQRADALTFAEPELYRLGLTFMLAWPYGRPSVMSSYAFDDIDERPPVGGDGLVVPVHDGDGACTQPWVCEHRWPHAAQMVEFRNRCAEAPLAHWWDDGADRIAFAREGCGFVAIARDPAAPLDQTLDTGLPQGTYCDVLSGRIDGDRCLGTVIEVAADGTASLDVPPLTAVAIHVGSRSR
jgi:alpha-amylase